MKKSKSISLNAILFCIAVLFFCSCHSKINNKAETLFKLVNADSSGIHFSNNISTTDTFNLFTFEYIYNGGGVGIGDFNNDGLQDILFIGNMVPSKLYLNKGNFHFEDVTINSGLIINGWPLGVSVADVDGDGLQDVYISMNGPGNKDIYPNKLFINQGSDKNNCPHFKEMAQEYGLADSGQSIQAAFFDYDHDGDLDIYLLTGGGFEVSPIAAHPIIKDGSARNTDRLYNNDFDKKLGHPFFTNVSKQAKILEEGYGLGVCLLDINDDGWLDVYVTNDYLSNDLLYVNNKDGTFSEEAAKYFNHTSHFAMGNDAGDINNDGLTDIIAVDMLPDKHYQRTLMLGPNQYDKFYYSVSHGYNFQYMRNTLQLNMGNGKFSEIGQLAGIYKTSWSWSPLFADLDNDGYQDIFITNGFGKDVTDLDFVKFRSDFLKNASAEKQNYIKVLLDSLSLRPGIKTHPYAYKNNGDYSFKEMSEQWGFNNSTFTNGAAYVDLDNDGDLDLVTNNIDEAANVNQNRLNEKAKKGTANFLNIKLKGTKYNSAATGSKVNIKYDNKMQTRLQSQVRGFESTVENIIHFGLGSQEKIDTIRVLWPDGNESVLTNIKVNQQLIIDYKGSRPQQIPLQSTLTKSFYNEVSPSALNIQYQNKANDFNDFNYERLLPKKYSKNGQGL
ncbi:MAG: CRTAC1 family protein, partial [Ginsengibacter sp.]